MAPRWFSHEYSYNFTVNGDYVLTILRDVVFICQITIFYIITFLRKVGLNLLFHPKGRALGYLYWQLNQSRRYSYNLQRLENIDKMTECCGATQFVSRVAHFIEISTYRPLQPTTTMQRTYVVRGLINIVHTINIERSWQHTHQTSSHAKLQERITLLGTLAEAIQCRYGLGTSTYIIHSWPRSHYA